MIIIDDNNNDNINNNNNKYKNIYDHLGDNEETIFMLHR